MSESLTSNILFILTMLTVLFNIYRSYSKPQQNLEISDLKLSNEVKDLRKQVQEIRETHIQNVQNVEKDIKLLNSAINDLSQTVVRLATIIDERIPRANVQ